MSGLTIGIALREASIGLCIRRLTVVLVEMGKHSSFAQAFTECFLEYGRWLWLLVIKIYAFDFDVFREVLWSD